MQAKKNDPPRNNELKEDCRSMSAMAMRQKICVTL